MISVSLINFKTSDKKQTKETYFNDDGNTYNLEDKKYNTELYICNSNNNVCEIVN